MTYDESAALMMSQPFRGRIKVAALSYATSIIDEAATVASHNSRLRWAQTCYQQPDMTAGQLQSPTVMDPGVQTSTQPDGTDVTDAALQGAVQAVVDKII
jgi:hypothetical protein